MSKVTFKKFSTLEEANYILNLLKKNTIDFEFSENKSSLDSNFSSVLLNEYEIKLDKVDFNKAELIISNDSQEIIKNLPSDYYLFSFSDEELKEIVFKKDEWNELDYNLSLQILKERGIVLSKDEIREIDKKRLDELRKPEKSNEYWIYGGYILCILGGLLGFIIGYVLYSQKKTLPNGQRVYEYVESDRRHGKRMIKLGIVVLVINIILNFVIF